MLRRAVTTLAWGVIALVPAAIALITVAVEPETAHALPAPIGPGTTIPTRAVPESPPRAASGPFRGFELEPVASGFDSPLDVAVAPGSDDLYVVEKTGRIEVVVDGRTLPEPFLDVSASIATYAEQGLLDLEFHPGYQANGRAFVHYTNLAGDTRVVEVTRSDDDLHRADPASERTILAVDQPHFYHKGGMLQIGPDGYLWIGLGDGGGQDDRFGHGQRPDTLLAALLRIDVDAARPYAIPPDNPFVAGGGAPEVWAYGLRNPWRFWVDAESHQVYITDVGQDRWEELNVVPIRSGGANFGWSVREGAECFRGDDCDGDFVDPVLAYPHDRTCAIIGGPVYRGSAIPELFGSFVYADYCAGWIRAVRIDQGVVVSTMEVAEGTGEMLSSFGVDGDGEILVVAGDSVYRLVATRAD